MVTEIGRLVARRSRRWKCAGIDPYSREEEDKEEEGESHEEDEEGRGTGWETNNEEIHRQLVESVVGWEGGGRGNEGEGGEREAIRLI